MISLIALQNYNAILTSQIVSLNRFNLTNRKIMSVKVWTKYISGWDKT